MKRVDLILAPYEYIINNYTNIGLQLKDNILIFDEGHNVSAKLKEAESITISAEELKELDENSELNYNRAA